ncbi:MAG TPA: glycosyltransferase family 39 protein [Methylomirabilota bacterium]|nr:glycosyltransferase family 39 protein [Methylomirabilota bacterium]
MTAIRLLVVWAVAALALLAWSGLTGPAEVTTPPAPARIVLAQPPGAPILALWLRWEAPSGSGGWVTLEPDEASPASVDEVYLRRRVHPGWNQLVWDDFSGFPAGRPVRLRVLEGDGLIRIGSARASSWYTLEHVRSLRGLAAALVLGGGVAGALGWRWLRGAAWRRPRPWHLAVLAIAAAALALRLYTLTTQSFWFDEVLTAIGAQSFTWVLYSAQIFGHPPLQYLVGWAAGGAAATEGSLRAPFVAAGVAGVVVMALLGRRLAGPATGLLAAGLLAVSPYHVEVSQLARPYALLVLAVGLSWLALFRALERGGALDWLGFSAAAALACYTHYLGGQLVLVQAAVAALWVARRRDARGLAALVSFAGVALLLAPWVEVVRPLAGAQLGAGELSAAAIGDFIVRVLIPEQLGAGPAGLLTAALLLLGLWGLRGRPEVALAAILSVALPIALLWAINPAHPLAGRHFAFLLPTVMLLVAHGLVMTGRFVETALAWRPAMPRPQGRRAAAAAVAVALIVASHLPAGATLGGYYQWRHGTDWRTVAEVLDRLVGPDDEVLATLGAVYPLRHYWRPTVHEVDAERLQARSRAGPGARRAWIVTIEDWDRAPELHRWLAGHAIRAGEVPPAWSRQRVYIHAVAARR